MTSPTRAIPPFVQLQHARGSCAAGRNLSLPIRYIDRRHRSADPRL